MFYANFIYFIVAIILFSSAPQSRAPLFSLFGDLIWMGLVIFLFWHFNRSHFKRLRANLDAESMDLNRAKKEYHRLIGLNTAIAIIHPDTRRALTCIGGCGRTVEHSGRCIQGQPCRPIYQ